MVFRHLVGYKPTEMTDADKFAILNVSKLIAQVLSDKLVLVTTNAVEWTAEDFLVNKWRRLQLIEMIKYFSHFDSIANKSDPVPLDRSNF